jgi:hypothetical protein
VSKNDPRAAKARTIAASHHAGRTENEKNPQTSKFFSKLLRESSFCRSSPSRNSGIIAQQ